MSGAEVVRIFEPGPKVIACQQRKARVRMILAGDVGGTKTRLGLFEQHGDQIRAFERAQFPSQEFEGLGEIARRFFSERPSPQLDACCFGVAGAVLQGRAQPPNLPWAVDAHELAAELECPRVLLINDLEATALGLARLTPADLVTIQEGLEVSGNAGVIAAGTGLGAAGLFWDGRQHHPFACEGGHGDFAPRSGRQMQLLAYLANRHGRVSYERILSGPGLVAIYEFLRDEGVAKEPAWLATQMQSDDPAAAISKAALEGTSELCRQALDLFVSCYGAEAGNLALKLMAVGGIYVGGGIAPRILPKLQNGTFQKSFIDKGRLQSLMERIPVHVIVNDCTALLGAASRAAREISEVSV